MGMNFNNVAEMFQRSEVRDRKINKLVHIIIQSIGFID
jgi:hypothetical protein